MKTKIPCVGVEIWSFGEYGKVEHSKLGADDEIIEIGENRRVGRRNEAWWTAALPLDRWSTRMDSCPVPPVLWERFDA